MHFRVSFFIYCKNRCFGPLPAPAPRHFLYMELFSPVLSSEPVSEEVLSRLSSVLELFSDLGSRLAESFPLPDRDASPESTPLLEDLLLPPPPPLLRRSLLPCCG